MRCLIRVSVRVSGGFFAGGAQSAGRPNKGSFLMHYLLDTNMCIYLIKQRPRQVLEKFQKHSPTDVAVSSITLFELEHGVEKSYMKDRSAKALKKFLSPLNLVTFDGEAASKAASVRAELEKKGAPIGAYDLLIAGVALAKGMSLVTNNDMEFRKINDLLIENWVDEALLTFGNYSN